MKSKVVVNGFVSFEMLVLKNTFDDAFGSVSKSIRFEFAQACERLFSNYRYSIVITKDKCTCLVGDPRDNRFVSLVLEK